MFIEIGEKYKKPQFKDFMIMASNEIHEEILYELEKKGHEVDSFGIGTNLITCLKQPALGMVYKLVSIEKVPRLKLSEDFDKITLPGSKSIYRLYLKDPTKPSFDIITLREEEAPKENVKIKVMDSTKPKEVLEFVPIKVELLNPLAFDGRNLTTASSIKESQQNIYKQLDSFDPALSRRIKPEKYPVYYSVDLYKLVELLMSKAKTK